MYVFSNLFPAVASSFLLFLKRKGYGGSLIFTVQMWTLASLSHLGDNLPFLGSFLRKRYCTERRKDEVSLIVHPTLEGIMSLLVSHVSAKQLPKVTYESYLPLSMDFINVHSFANKYSARVHKNGRLEYSSRPFLCALDSVLALFPGPLRYSSLAICAWGELRNNTSSTHCVCY